MNENFFEQLNLVLRTKRYQIFIIIISFLLLSFMEAFGIGLIIPFISNLLSTNEELKFVNLNNIPILDQFLNFFEIKESQDILILISFIFLIKTILAIYLNYKIISFSYKNQKNLILKIVNNYATLNTLEIQTKESAKVIQNLINNTDIVIIGTIIPFLKVVSEVIFVSTILTFLLYFQLKATLIIIIIFASFLTFFILFLKTKLNCQEK